MTDIKQIMARESARIIELRRALHRIPELGFDVVKTSKFVAETLSTLPGLTVKTGIAKTGILATLDTGRPGKTLLIRADMDALPIQEETGFEFASTHEGKMHACGHDANTAMALGAAIVLSQLKDRLTGTIKFMFQPAEEGPGGAEPMIQEGILENPTVDYSTACHLWPSLPAGTLGIKEGPMMAAVSTFDIEITGKGGHGAMPHMCVDALDTASQVVAALQRVVSRKMNPLKPSVVTVGSLHAGATHNAIPERATLAGTTRTFDRDVWENYPAMMEPVIKGVCDSMGATYTFDYKKIYPPMINDPDMTGRIKTAMATVVGEDKVETPEMTMGGEDMAFVFEKTRGCLFFLGTGFEGCSPLHSPKFAFDESLLALGSETFVRYALDLLGAE